MSGRSELSARVWPDLFDGELTNKRDEAVANPARFASAGKDKAKSGQRRL